MKKQTVVTIGLISLLLAGICFYAATQYIDVLAAEKLFASVIKVAKGKEILPYEPITREDVVIIQEEVDEILPGSFQTIESVLGKRSIQTIFEGEQLVDKKLQDGYLLPGNGTARYEFPLTALMPITELRKGDFVKVWVKYKSSAEMKTLPNPVHIRISNATADILFESQLVTVKDNNGVEIYTLKPNLIPNATQMEDSFFQGSEVKKYANGERRFRDYRAQPTALPAYIGFNLTDQQYLMLSEAFNFGTVQIGHILVEKGGY